MAEHQAETKNPKRMLRLALPIAAVLIAVSIYVLMPDRGTTISTGTTFAARKGNLQIKVLAGGTSEAIESQEIRSEIEGRDGAKILKIVDEGYVVTPEDVENNLVLVQLDSAQLEDEMIEEEKEFESARATYIESQANYDIQLNQNKSDVTAAELVSKFAKMDLQKYLGQSTVAQLLSELGLDERAEQIANAEVKIMSLDLPSVPPSAFEESHPELQQDRGQRGGGTPPWGDGPPPWRREGAGAGDGGADANAAPGEGRRGRRGAGGGAGGERVPGENWERPPDAEEPGGIPLDDELIDAIAEAAAANGMPMEPARFKEMLRARGGDDTPTMSPRMMERMSSMGIDVKAIAEGLGKSTEDGGETPTELPHSTTFAVEIDSEYLDKRANVDFSKYADANSLEDGQAKQELNRLQDEYLVAQENLSLAETDLEATERLVEREFETQTNLDRQRVSVQTNKIKVESAKVARELYIKYEFPKQVETLLSNYEESLAALERTRAEAAAKLLQAQARMTTAQKDYIREEQRVRDVKEQLSKTIISAERSGMVVYGTSNDRDFRGGSSEPIQEGTTVRERQLILTIPDMSEMAVTVKVHESSIKNLRKGQKSTIVIDSHPNPPLHGEVIKVGVLPDSSDRWMNPDIKQYNVQIRIEGTHEWLRPGMSARVEIHVDELKDVLHVPIQAVSAIGSERFCYVAMGTGTPERRVVETGGFNNDFIEITSGLKEGDIVLLNTPNIGERGTDPETDAPNEEEEKPEDDAPAESAA